MDLARAPAAGGVLATATLLVEPFARVRRGATLLVHSAGGFVRHPRPVAHTWRARVSSSGRSGRSPASTPRGRPAAARSSCAARARGRPVRGMRRRRRHPRPTGRRPLDLDLDVAAPVARSSTSGPRAATRSRPSAGRPTFARDASIGAFSLRAWPCWPEPGRRGASRRAPAHRRWGRSASPSQRDGLEAAPGARAGARRRGRQRRTPRRPPPVRPATLLDGGLLVGVT